MEKPYLKKYKEIEGFSVWIVDGNYIRTNLNEEFTNYGYHRRFEFIPAKEFWIDMEYSGDNEAEFYIDVMLNMEKFISQGMNHDESVKKVDAIEKRERRKSEFFKKNIKKINKKEEEINIVKKELLKGYSDKIKIWIVSGELVRGLFFLDFTEGGHEKVYHFIPKGDIWIDDDVSPNERKFVLLHEIHERTKMFKGMDYLPAHRSSSRIEFKYRKNPKEIDKILKEEIKETEKF